jgi:hypothetical protein
VRVGLQVVRIILHGYQRYTEHLETIKMARSVFSLRYVVELKFEKVNSVIE